MDYSHYITRDPKICGGQPVIKGTRVTLRTVLASLAEGADISEILADFPSLTEEAEEAFRDRNYKAASAYFDALARTDNTQYYNHVAMSKHGASMWRAAEPRGELSNEQEEQIGSAVALLAKASEHAQPRYKAEALYQRSKALYHLWRHSPNSADALLEEADKDAERAAELSHEEVHLSWYDHLHTFLDRTHATGAEPEAAET